MDEAQNARFEKTYEKYAAMLYRIAYLSVCKKAEAEDCVAETFLKYVQRGYDYVSEEHEKAWLIRVCINICKNFNKRAFNARTTELKDVYASADNGYADAEIRVLLSALPRKTNLALYLKYVEGFTSDEIGAILGMSGGGVRALLSRAAAALRLELDDASAPEQSDSLPRRSAK